MQEKFSKNLLRKNKGTATQISVQTSVKNMIVSNYLKTKQKYSSEMSKNLNDFLNQKISEDTYLKLQKKAIQNAFSESFKLGKFFGTNKFQDLDDSERRFVVFQTTKEMSFMKRFADAIKTQSGKMPYSRRLKMYVDSLDSMFGFGRLLYLPEDAKIIWQLGATDRHCPDCLMFAANNPYTKKTLPGYPKSGNSTCLSNCRCNLIYNYANNIVNSDYEQHILSSKGFNKNKNIPSEDEYKMLMSLREEFYYNRYMYEKTKLQQYKTYFKNIRNNINRYVKENNYHFPIDYPIQTPIKDFNSFLKHANFSLLDKSTYFSQNDFVAFFMADKMIYGKVYNKLQDNIYVKSLDSIEYVLDPRKAIIFKEIV